MLNNVLRVWVDDDIECDSKVFLYRRHRVVLLHQKARYLTCIFDFVFHAEEVLRQKFEYPALGRVEWCFVRNKETERERNSMCRRVTWCYLLLFLRERKGGSDSEVLFNSNFIRDRHHHNKVDRQKPAHHSVACIQGEA